MAKKNLYKFLDFLSKNEEALAKARQMAGDAAAIAAYGKELGYDFECQDIEEYQNKFFNTLKSKLEQKTLSHSGLETSKGVGQLKALMKLGETDETVAKRLAELGLGEAGGMVAYGKEMGFEFNEEDMLLLAKEIMEQTEELSDEELEIAAGGMALAIAVGVFLGVAAGAVIATVAGAAVGVGAVLLTNAVSKK